MNTLFDRSAAARLEWAIRRSQKTSELSDSDAELLKHYCAWLHNKLFCDDLNRITAGSGIRENHPGIFFKKTEAERIFRSVVADIAAQLDFTLLPNAEVQAVKEAMSTRRATKVKRAGVQFTSIQKFVSNGKRTIRGVASTIDMDRDGDIVDPRGGYWQVPIPLLWQHDPRSPIGSVISVEIRGSEIWIEAQIVEGIETADTCWKLIEAGVIDSFSIGFRPIEVDRLQSGGDIYRRWELLEVSCVSIPSNPSARIRRSHDGAVKLTHSGTVKLNSASRQGDRESALRNGAVSLKRGDKK